MQQALALKIQEPPTFTRKPRLPRYQRVKNAPGMVLTQRDRDILKHVHLYRMLTREQVERLLFQPEQGQPHPTKTSRARLRLKLLYHHGYLERIPMPVGAATWAWRPVYRLARKGAEVIAGELGIPPSQVQYWRKGDENHQRTSEVSLLFLQHTLAINDVRIGMEQVARFHGYRVEKWVDEAQLKGQEMRDYVTIATERGKQQKVPVIPDAYFVLHLGDRRAHFFLELDRATMTNQRWKTRVLAYLNYVRSGRYTERYQTKSLRILTVTTTEQRLINLKKSTREAGGNEVFWFATFAELTTRDPLLSSIWLLASDETDRSRQSLVS